MAYIGSPAAPTIATVSDDTITSAKIADDAVTSAKLDTNIAVDGNLTVDTNTLYVDSTNNRVGIGTSSPSNKLKIYDSTATSTTFKANTLLNVSSNGSGADATINLTDGVANNAVISQLSGQLLFGTGAGAPERMRIDSSGNVGIGTTGPGEKLDVQGNIRLTGGDTYVKFVNAGGYDFSIRGDSGNALRFYSPEYSGTPGISMLNNLDVLYGGTGYPANGTAGTLIQNGRIDISRNSDYCFQLRRFNNDGQVAFFFRDANNVGNIAVNNSSTSYNSASDYRLKENVVEVTDGIDRVKLLKPSRFNFIVDPDKTVDGFLAHEVQNVVPEAITGTKDAMRTEDVYDEDGNVTGTQEVPEYQGIDQSKLVPLLTAALQEAIAKIESLEARVATLESA